MIRESRLLRATILTVWLYSLLCWMYVAARIIIYDFIVFHPFIYFIPWLSFGTLGAITFTLSAFCMLVYLYLWGFSRDRSPLLR